MRWPLCLLLAVSAGCGDAPAPGGAPPPAPFADAPGQLAWQGLLACADCDGIDTQLRLLRDPQPRYELVETFLAEDGPARFVEQGSWSREGPLLRLQAAAEGAGVRVFAIEADGRLTLREADGAPPPGPPRLLEPVTSPPPP